MTNLGISDCETQSVRLGWNPARLHLVHSLNKLEWSYEVAANKLAINERTVRRYCNGESPVPPLVTFFLKALLQPKDASKLAKQAAKIGVIQANE